MSHLHERFVFTASAFVVYQGRVLLRKHDKYHMWLAPGGHIEPDEDPSEAVLREVKEETGLNIKILGRELQQFPDQTKDIPAPAFINRHFASEGHDHIDLLYVAYALTTEIIPAEGESNDPEDFHWFSDEELMQGKHNVIPRIQYYAREALKIAQSYD